MFQLSLVVKVPSLYEFFIHVSIACVIVFFWIHSLNLSALHFHVYTLYIHTIVAKPINRYAVPCLSF